MKSKIAMPRAAVLYFEQVWARHHPRGTIMLRGLTDLYMYPKVRVYSQNPS